MMKLNIYKKLRKKYSEFVYQILDTDNNRRENIIRTGKILKFWDGEKLVFEDEQEMDVLTEYILYEHKQNGKRLIDVFKDQRNKFSKDEDEILNGMLLNRHSLFEVIEINSKKSTVLLKDQLNKQVHELMDISFSKTAETGMLISTRLVSVYDINMTSGLIFHFKKNKRLKILTELSNQNKNIFETIYKCSKLYGVQVTTF